MANQAILDLANMLNGGSVASPEAAPSATVTPNPRGGGGGSWGPSTPSNAAKPGTKTNIPSSVVPQNPTTSNSGNSTGGSDNGGSSTVNTKDPNNNPYGDNGWWDAADGWKQKVTDASSEAAAREAALRNTISSQWDSVFGYLDQVGDRLPGQRDEQVGQINNLFGSSQGELNTARDYANGKIAANQKKTLTSLADDLRSALQAGNTYLGQRGASDSSAAERYNTALMKSANKQRGEVMSQSDGQRAQVQNTYDTNMAKLQEWQDTKVFELGQWYNDAKNNLDYQRANASGQKAQALASLDAQLHQIALDRLRSIENEANSWKNTVNAWMLEQNGNISSAVGSMQNMPMAPTYSALATAQSTPQNTTPVLGAGYSSTDEEKAGQSALNLGSIANNSGLAWSS